MKITAIVQARMGSTRLPGKVLMDLGGHTVLARVVGRLRRASLVGEIVVATTNLTIDEPITEECNRLQVACFHGSEHDVLDRYFRAARHFRAEAILRITADCPLIDFEVVDALIRPFRDQQPDFACNVLRRTYPRGLDAEVFTAGGLEKARHLADRPYQREHVTPFFYDRPDLFRLLSVHGEQDYSAYRWTLDTPDDLRLIRAIYASFNNQESFSWREVTALMQRSPGLAAINEQIVQKPIRESAILG